MKLNLFKYFSIFTSIFIVCLIYLSVIGLETKKFNNQIKDKLNQVDNNLTVELKKVKLTLDLFNFKINAKTVGSEIFYKGKNLQLEYIQTKISLISFIENKFVSSSVQISTRSIMAKDLVSFIRTISNKPELFILESSIKNGQVIADINLNFDEKGNLKEDYTIKAILKDAKISLFKIYNFEKINLLIDVKNNVFNLNEINFKTNKLNFYSNNIKIKKNKKLFSVEGDIENKNSILTDELLTLFNNNFKDIKFLDIDFNSKNKFSFSIDGKFNVKDLDISSSIVINETEYLKPIVLNEYLKSKRDRIKISNHKIKFKSKNNLTTIEGYGKIKLDKVFDDINYKLNFEDKNFNLNSNINLSNLNLNEFSFLKPFFPKLGKTVDLKNSEIQINYDGKIFSAKGTSKIKLENEFEDINFRFSNINDKFNFDINIGLTKTLFNLNFLNFEKNKALTTKLKIIGNSSSDKKLYFKEINISDEDNNIILSNLELNEINQIIKIDKLDVNYFDNQKRKNIFLLTKKQQNEYQLDGSVFNADQLIENLLNSKELKDEKIFKNDLTLSIYLKEAYMDKDTIINDLNGKLSIKDNKIFNANINGNFVDSEDLKFTINTNKSGEKITTLFSSRAKPIVSRYKFIKGYEEGYLDFYSSKKGNVSQSKLKIYDFKLQKLPALTKLLSLASLQGIADTLSGEGIRFKEFEMNFKNNENLMRIEEIYAIGPAISILMNGYIEENKLISLRGTLVPATTINKTIGSIPFLGKILVGDKTGEGVFGVSFKIKGMPKSLETTVNPIKTLTPRFITRTLEKIKKN